jgi:uncharacterized protein (TIGR03437 family)
MAGNLANVGEDDATVNVTALVGKLPPGTYTGRIIVSVASIGIVKNSPAIIPVTFRVRQPRPPDLQVRPAGIALLAPSARQNPPPEPLAIFNTGEMNLNWRTAVSTASGGAWLSVTPASGSGPNTLASVKADVSGLTPGNYSGKITISAEGATNSPTEIPVTLNVPTAPPLTLRLSGVRLEPGEVRVPVREAVPGFFTWNRDRAVAVNGDGTANGPDSPAPIGSVIQTYLTGQGLVSPRIETGSSGPSAPPFPETTLPVVATLNSIAARVLYAGLASGMAGVLQLNLEIPQGVGASERVRLVANIGGVSTPVTFVSVSTEPRP